MTVQPGIDTGRLVGAKPLAPKGRLAENVVHFVRVLRAAGLPVGPARALAALEAIEAVGLANREDFRAALAAVLVSRYEQLPIFEQAFDLFWRNPKLLEKLIASLLPKVFCRGGEPPPEPELPARIAQAMLPPAQPDLPREDDDEIDLDAAFTMSPREILQHKDFETMTAEELAAVRSDAAQSAAAAAGVAYAAHCAVDARSPRRPSRDAAAGDRCGRFAVAARLAQAAAAHSAARRAVRYLGLDGPLCADAAALPACDHQRSRSRPRAALRHPPHQHHAALEAPRCRRGARRG